MGMEGVADPMASLPLDLRAIHDAKDEDSTKKDTSPSPGHIDGSIHPPSQASLVEGGREHGSNLLDLARSAETLPMCGQIRKPRQPVTQPTDPNPGVPCLRCEGTGRLQAECDACGRRGEIVVSCRKCSGKGVYSQKAGPCGRCGATGVLEDGSTCPRCKGHKAQLAFSTPCLKCSGSGSLKVPCKRCGGSLRMQADCPNCQGTGTYRKPS